MSASIEPWPTRYVLMLTNMWRSSPRDASPAYATPIVRQLLGLLTLLLVLVPASTASARVAIRVGIGDQNVSIFDQSAFQRAKFERVRYIVPWNAMDNT